MKQLLITVMTLLVMSNVVSAQQSRSDEKLEFRPNWGLKVQGGASFTIGEADFSKLLSPAAQLSATYNFHHAMGVRFGFSGWEGKGTVVVTDEMYSFRFLQLNADYVLDLASLFGGFKHDRIWTPYVFAGIGGAYGFDNKEAGKYVAEFGDVLSRYWETAPFFVVRAGLGVDFWVAKNVALGLEANANGYSDKFNSKGAVSGFNPDFQFNALLGLKFRFGGNTRPSKAYADKVAAEEAAEAARLAAEKAAAEKAAAEKAAAEKAAAEKAAAEKAAAEKAAAEKAAAEKAAAERARICAEQSTDVFFTIGSYSIRKSEMPKIDKLVEFLKANPDYSVSLVGYADKATGTSARNLVISKERVNAVKAKMIQLGAPADRIETDYVGDTVQPYVENDQNRVIICTVK
ncbi:MAG: OmpA family protein [Bacteroidales bacterium]|nr:OmpA family protein [Bacteroidales bacterium]